MLWRTGRPAKRSGTVEPCVPTRVSKPPVGPQWIHEIKHDGYRLIARKQGDRVRLFTRRGYDWTERYPLIRKAMAASRRFARWSTARRCAVRMPALRCSRGCRAAPATIRFFLRLRPARIERPRTGAPDPRGAQGPTREPADQGAGWDPIQRAPRRRRRQHLCARLQDGARRHRLKAP